MFVSEFIGNAYMQNYIDYNYYLILKKYFKLFQANNSFFTNPEPR